MNMFIECLLPVCTTVEPRQSHAHCVPAAHGCTHRRADPSLCGQNLSEVRCRKKVGGEEEGGTLGQGQTTHRQEGYDFGPEHNPLHGCTISVVLRKRDRGE